jgi:hypothetical protein
MINLRTISTTIGILLILITHIQCASSQQIDIKTPIELKDVYFQNQVAGAEGGSSGFMLYIEVNSTSDIQLEYAYFKGKKIELEHKTSELVYVGRHTYPSRKQDLIMSDDPRDEFKNQLLAVEKKPPFELKNNECIVAYTKKGKKRYFKLNNVPEKEE